MNDSMIRDISLSEEGLQRIRWVGKFMPALNALKRDFINNQALKGKTIVMSIHLEAKTAYLALTLQSAGADVIVTGSNPLSTQDPIAAGLVNQGITVYAWHGCTDEEYTMFLNKALDHMPHIIIDDGGDLVHLLHSDRTDAKKNLIGGSEETTTGVYRLKALEKENKLTFPMIAVNDSSLVSVIGFEELTRRGQLIIAQTCMGRGDSQYQFNSNRKNRCCSGVWMVWKGRFYAC